MCSWIELGNDPVSIWVLDLLVSIHCPFIYDDPFMMEFVFVNCFINIFFFIVIVPFICFSFALLFVIFYDGVLELTMKIREFPLLEMQGP